MQMNITERLSRFRCSGSWCATDDHWQWKLCSLHCHCRVTVQVPHGSHILIYNFSSVLDISESKSE